MLKKELEKITREGLFRFLRRVESEQSTHIVIQGRRVLHLAGNNYLDLANDPRVKDAAIRAIKKYGVGAGASRLISGTTSLHEELETALASFKGTEAALVFSSGYHVNIGLPAALVGEGDLILADRLNHASLVDGCRLSQATFKVYHHRETAHLKRLLTQREKYRRILIVTDGIFSMDGDIAPLPEIVALARAADAWVFLDDAHGTGVLGEGGRGTLEHCGITEGVEVQMGTLGKALGCFGAYVAGSRDMISYLINTCRSFLYTTALPPAIAGAAIAALQIIRSEPERRQRLWERRSSFVEGLRTLGFNTHTSETPIIPLIVGDPDRTVTLSERLLEAGIYAPAIRPPTVPRGTSRIRISLMATHTRQDLEYALEVLGKAGKDLGII